MAAPPMIRDGVLIVPDGCGSGGPEIEQTEQTLRAFEVFSDAYLQEVRRVFLLKGAKAPAILANLQRFNALLQSRRLAPMRAKTISPDSATGRKIKAFVAEIQEVGDRRGFFTMASTAPEAPPAGSRLAELQVINGRTAEALFAAVPEINPETCTGCDACLRVCPQTVLTEINDEGGKAYYNCNPDACDACGLCVDVCPTDAIRISTMAHAPADLRLTEWVCRACGVPVHAPQGRGEGDRLCDICERGGHHKKLFQVLP